MEPDPEQRKNPITGINELAWHIYTENGVEPAFRPHAGSFRARLCGRWDVYERDAPTVAGPLPTVRRPTQR